MARAIPYKPVPESADMRRVPRVSIPTPDEAFGVGIGKAEKALGQQQIGLGEQEWAQGNATIGLGTRMEGAGKDVGDSVIAVQNLNNETAAKEADVSVMVAIGQEKAKFDQLEGLDAARGLPAFQQRIQDIRKNALDSMPNADARRMLDNSIARRVGFALVDAGGRAGTQSKKAADDASKARVETAISQADLSDPATFSHDLQAVRHEVRAQGEHAGAEADTVANETRKKQSLMYLSGFQKLAPNNPELAEARFNEVKEHLDPNVREQVQTIIDKNMAYKQARTDAQDIIDKKFDPSKGPGQLEDVLAEGKKYAEKHPDNPFYADNLETRLRSKVNLGLQGYHDTHLANSLTVKQFILGQDAFKKIVDIDAITGPDADPAIRSAYNSLNANEQKAIQDFIASKNKINVPYTAERQTRFFQLMGLSREQPDKFQELMLVDEDLPRGKIEELMRRQMDIKAGRAEDSHMDGLVRNIQPILNSVQIGPSRTDTKMNDKYLQVTGRFRSEIDQWRNSHDGKWPTEDEARGIASRIIKSESSWWGSKTYEFQKVPEADRNAIIAAYKKVYNKAPTETDIINEYNASRRRKPGAN